MTVKLNGGYGGVRFCLGGVQVKGWAEKFNITSVNILVTSASNSAVPLALTDAHTSHRPGT
jgi:hypothetical protein